MQFEIFVTMQKYAMERSSRVLSTLSEILLYASSLRRHKDIWRKISGLWDQVTQMFSLRLHHAKLEQAVAMQSHSYAQSRGQVAGQVSHASLPTMQTYEVAFPKIITGAEDVRRKRMEASFQLQKVDGQISLNQLLRHVHQLLHRLASPDKNESSQLKQARMMLMLDRIHRNYELGLETIKIICRNLDFAQFKISAGVHAGSRGICNADISDLFAQFPLLLDTTISKDKAIGHAWLVPFLIMVKPQV